MIKICQWCGKQFEINNPHQNSRKYCSDKCYTESNRKRNRKSTKPPKIKIEPEKEQRKYCKRYSCLYHPQKSAANNCDYTLVTGELRGCPSGDGCTRYKRATAKERQRRQIDNAKNGYWGWYCASYRQVKRKSLEVNNGTNRNNQRPCF